jgi:hypothetical protein
VGISKKEPWEAYPTIWKTKAAFFTYLRGHLRQIWSRYPAKLTWKKAQGVKPPADYTGRAKTLCKCFYCGEFFPISSTEVDHVKMAGSCNDWDTAKEFLHNLLDCSGEWRITCKPCHKVITYAERMGVTFEESVAMKKAIEFMKEDKQVVLDFLASHGYNGPSVSTAAKRKKLVEQLFKENQ